MIWPVPPQWRAHAGALSAQWLSILFTAAVSLALSVWLARGMGPTGFGRYAYLLNLATMLALMQDAGLRTLILRELVVPSPPLMAFHAALPRLARGHLLMVTTLLVCASMVLSPFAGDPALVWAVLCCAAVTLSQLVSAQLKAAGQWARDARWQAGARALSALLVVGAVLMLGTDPRVVFGAWGLGVLLAYALLPGDLRHRPQWPAHLPVYRAAAGFLWIDLATCVYRRSDIMILHRTAAPSDVGQYAAAYRVFDGVLLLVAPLALLFFRQLRLTHADTAAAQRLHGRTLLGAAAAGMGLAVGGACLGHWVIALFYGAAYQVVAGSLLSWLFAAFVFVLPNSVLTQTAIALERQRWYVTGASLAAVTNLALNLVLTPHYGVRAAAAAVIATEAVLGATLWIGVRDALRR